MSPLEAEVQAKLHLAHVGSGGDCSGSRLVHVIVGRTQIHMVGGVEILPLELQRLSFRHGEGLAE